ncbi:glutaminyl-peptide cyclotransferase [Tenacibaculum sp. M341]|uniref:glutaminyl-peptide cyclotransferase n=1 Tax=Tenacibaculum sp. M341 TaxID=2530339 RepID=UPI001044949C|nr:glutaminyl-peptide cyclotransferase [Tenacibaculum sp. M341]TCI84683.1 glutaminyl-peptide cyclotransferase [Tenacibaculum sp. M341]
MKLNLYNILLLTLTSSLFSCSETSYQFKIKTDAKTTIGKKVDVELQQISGNTPDSIHFYVNNKRVDLQNNKITLNTSEIGIGKHRLTALAFVPGKVKKINNSIEVYSNVKPSLYSYKIVNTYPHDTKSFTQGLEFHNGFLYETTGKRGRSKLRKIETETGKVLQEYKLDDKYFGEGMTIVGNDIFWLTWQARKGFIFDLETFELKKEFEYDKSNEGWGLTHDDKNLIKSDGSNKIWFLDPSNQQEITSIQAYTDKLSLQKLNELEYFNGKIYANYWQKPLIAIIDPNSGIVEGIINLKGLVTEVSKTQKLDTNEDVLNGIAFDKENNRLFVTGKNWSKLFEIELIKQ